jgi:catechol 2,3-dioxygenase-like lactoylglutathione lyase family enzyme
MTVQLHHALVPSNDAELAAEWFSKIMDVPREGTTVRLGEVQILEFVPRTQFSGQGGERHFCFRVGDREFDGILTRVRGEGIKVRSDPGAPRSGGGPNDQINYYDGGRGFYFSSPEGHGYEVITQPYTRGSRAPHDVKPARANV